MQKRIQWKYLYRFACAALLTIWAAGLFIAAWYDFVLVNNQTGHLTGWGNLGMSLLLYIAVFVLVGRWLHAFKIGVERKASVMASQVLTLLVTDFIELFLSLAITGQFRFLGEFCGIYAVMYLIQAPVASLLVIPMINLYRKIFPPLQLLEIHGEETISFAGECCEDRTGDDKGSWLHSVTEKRISHEGHETGSVAGDPLLNAAAPGQLHLDTLGQKVDGLPTKYHITHYLSCHESDEVLRAAMAQTDAVLVGDLPAADKNHILKLCYDQDKRVYFVPKLSDVIVKGSEELNLFDTPLFLCRNRGISAGELAVKRTFDIVASLLALVILSPIFAITAIAIKAEDGGPVFYRQERCTIGGKRFMILKFRSMIVNAEQDGRPHPAGEHDDRITKVGRFIRACRIDELPQLINIIRGDMSIVGPRPERVEHVAKYTADIPEFTFRTKVKAGLTGMAQVYGRYNTTALDKLKYDLLYITDFSLLLDLQIIFETVKILVQKESTEGFSEEQAAQMREEASKE